MRLFKFMFFYINIRVNVLLVVQIGVFYSPRWICVIFNGDVFGVNFVQICILYTFRIWIFTNNFILVEVLRYYPISIFDWENTWSLKSNPVRIYCWSIFILPVEERKSSLINSWKKKVSNTFNMHVKVKRIHSTLIIQL